MRFNSLNIVIGLSAVILTVVTIADASAAGRNPAGKQMKVCSSDINNPTVVNIGVLSRAGASVAFRKFYQGTAPKVTVYSYKGVKGYRARSLVKNYRTGGMYLARCYFKSKNGTVRN